MMFRQPETEAVSRGDPSTISRRLAHAGWFTWVQLDLAGVTVFLRRGRGAAGDKKPLPDAEATYRGICNRGTSDLS